MAWILENDEWCDLLELAYRAARQVLGEHEAAFDAATCALEHLLDKERRGQAMPQNVRAVAGVVAGNLARDRLAGGSAYHTARGRRSGRSAVRQRGRVAPPPPSRATGRAPEQARLFEPAPRVPVRAA